MNNPYYSYYLTPRCLFFLFVLLTHHLTVSSSVSSWHGFHTTMAGVHSSVFIYIFHQQVLTLTTFERIFLKNVTLQ